MKRSEAAFTLLEVLVAVAILATAFVAIVGLQSQSIATIGRLSERFEAQLMADDAYVRHKLRMEGYDVERVHPELAERHPDWEIEVVPEPLSTEELPFVPVLPVGWTAEWIRVRVRDGAGRVLASERPLWAHQVPGKLGQ